MWATACLIVIIAASACGSGDKTSPRTAVAASCRGIDELDSYPATPSWSSSRLQRSRRNQAPARPRRGGVRRDANRPVFPRFRDRGAHVAPDRTQAILQFEEDEVEVRAIGDRRWGALWNYVGAADDALAGNRIPDARRSCARTSYCKSLTGWTYLPRPGEEEVTDCRDSALHAGQGRPEPSAAAPPAPIRAPRLRTNSRWMSIAKDGEWPSETGHQRRGYRRAGNPLSMKLFMELRDVNDRRGIDEPVVNAPTG